MNLLAIQASGAEETAIWGFHANYEDASIYPQPTGTASLFRLLSGKCRSRDVAIVAIVLDEEILGQE